MRFDVNVVEESEIEPSLEVLLEKGLKGAKAQVVFEGFCTALMGVEGLKSGRKKRARNLIDE